MNIKEYMVRDHKACDQHFAKAEHAASAQDWVGAVEEFNGFILAMERHLGVEEESLFPAFEQATGVVAGPTEMMRMEHGQMRTLFDEMREALKAKHSDDYLGASETLLILMQQHNIKEEQILYTIMVEHLLEDASFLQQKFDEWNER